MSGTFGLIFHISNKIDTITFKEFKQGFSFLRDQADKLTASQWLLCMEHSQPNCNINKLQYANSHRNTEIILNNEKSMLQVVLTLSEFKLTI